MEPEPNDRPSTVEDARPRNPAEHLKGHRWQKGQSGNPGGRPKGVSVTASLRAILAREVNGKTVADLIAERMVKDALSGKFPQAKEILDRADGKVTDKHEISGDKAGGEIVILRVSPPQLIGEPEADRRAEAEHQRQIEDCMKQVPPSDLPRKIIVGDWPNRV
jgi:hypothetical protein